MTPRCPPVSTEKENEHPVSFCWLLTQVSSAHNGSYLGTFCTTVSARVVEQRSTQALPQELPVVPQFLWTKPRPSATPLQQELQLPLPGG